MMELVDGPTLASLIEKGPVTVLEGPDNSTSHRFPSFLPDGRHFLYVSGTSQAKAYCVWRPWIQSRTEF